LIESNCVLDGPLQNSNFLFQSEIEDGIMAVQI